LVYYDDKKSILLLKHDLPSQKFIMSNEKILIVDDDSSITRLISDCLKRKGYKTIIARDGYDAINLVEEKVPDLIILDILMPKVDGRDVCKRIRKWSDVPIMIISALYQTDYKVACFELGANDYVVKPFDIEELVARIKALLNTCKKRGCAVQKPCIKKGTLEVNFNTGIITLFDKPLKLTKTEYALLNEFALNQGKVLTHEYLLSKIWGFEFNDQKEYLRVHISHLRSKLDPANYNVYIETISGVGYKF
jgi:DNA-binding response OmpR family regulator